MDGVRCMPRGRADGGPVSLMCWGWAFRTTASGVHLVTLKALTSPPPSICIFIHLPGHWGAAVPTQPSLSLCSIYMDHRKQDHSSSSFAAILFLIVSAQAFTTLSFMLSLWGWGGFRDFFKVFTADQDRSGSVGPVGKATVPSCGRVRSLQQRSESLKDQIFVVLNMLPAFLKKKVISRLSSYAPCLW